MDIGKNIKQLREIRGYTQEYLASKIGVSQKKLSRIENSDTSPTFDIVLKICESLEITIQGLLKY